MVQLLPGSANPDKKTIGENLQGELQRIVTNQSSFYGSFESSLGTWNLYNTGNGITVNTDEQRSNSNASNGGVFFVDISNSDATSDYRHARYRKTDVSVDNVLKVEIRLNITQLSSSGEKARIDVRDSDNNRTIFEKDTETNGFETFSFEFSSSYNMGNMEIWVGPGIGSSRAEFEIDYLKVTKDIKPGQKTEEVILDGSGE